MEDENMDEPEHSTLPSTKSVDPDKYRTGRVIAIRDTAFVTLVFITSHVYCLIHLYLDGTL